MPVVLVVMNVLKLACCSSPGLHRLGSQQQSCRRGLKPLSPPLLPHPRSSRRSSASSMPSARVTTGNCKTSSASRPETSAASTSSRPLPTTSSSPAGTSTR
eukprot:755135-Hanusia_phi.AAC.8